MNNLRWVRGVDGKKHLIDAKYREGTEILRPIMGKYAMTKGDILNIDIEDAGVILEDLRYGTTTYKAKRFSVEVSSPVTISLFVEAEGIDEWCDFLLELRNGSK